jgi:hypothetical protein
LHRVDEPASDRLPSLADSLDQTVHQLTHSHPDPSKEEPSRAAPSDVLVPALSGAFSCGFSRRFQRDCRSLSLADSLQRATRRHAIPPALVLLLLLLRLLLEPLLKTLIFRCHSAPYNSCSKQLEIVAEILLLRNTTS